MSALKKHIDDVVEAIVDGMDRAGAGAATRFGHMRTHADEAVMKFGDLDDELAGAASSAARPRPRPGFDAHGDVNPADFATEPDTAYFWSGRVGGPDGVGVEPDARAAASESGGTTLEQLLEARGIAMPEWDDTDESVKDTWTKVSEAYASQVRGDVHVVLGDSIRPGAVWFAEFEKLKANANVTQIIQVHPRTHGGTVIWP